MNIDKIHRSLNLNQTKTDIVIDEIKIVASNINLNNRYFLLLISPNHHF